MSTRTAFLETARAVRPMLDEPSLVSRWNDASALERMTIGELTAHLVRAVRTAATYLASSNPGLGDDLIDASAYYAALQGVATTEGPDLDHDTHVAVRRRASEEAEQGIAGVRAVWDEAMSELEASLATEPPTRTVSVYGGLRMMLDDYLITRLVELVVHTDDLAVSLGVEAPALPARAQRLVIDCLVGVAMQRHGATAVIRAMTRAERDMIRALRVL